ncbi:DUF397 domain-containing protein [Embleya sp. NPDC050493]|uniref:DUF397 domain-containing protein n=1 Tax=Embleya sp. NPDC050493 TaxID=3363989 RepID=UPI0037BD9ED8
MSTENHLSAILEPWWHKNSYSGTGGGDCVEVAGNRDLIHIRDSRAILPAQNLGFEIRHWITFVASASDRWPD